MQRFLGLLKDLEADLDGESIADLLWLARKIKIPPVEVEPVTPVVISIAPPQPDRSEGSQKSTDRSQPPAQDVAKAIIPDRPDHSGMSMPTVPAAKATELPFKAPQAPALRHTLELGRALRPLMRKVPSRTEWAIDEEATAIAMVENPHRRWLPVMRAAPERWLDLVLVVENSRSTIIWKELIGEVQQLFERQGAFRTIRRWILQVHESAEFQLLPQNYSRRDLLKPRSPKELLDPTGRQLILLLSDCVSPIWEQGRIHPWLKEWSVGSRMTILQLLPQRLWDRTCLGSGSLLSVSALVPGTLNAQLTLHDVPEWLEVNRSRDLIVPIITLEPDSLTAWARVMDGSNAQSAGVLFEWAAVQTEDDYEWPELEPDELLQRFRVTASPLARRLACLMSIGPVILPVVHLIQEAMLPGSSQTHVAEVFMSGLLQRNVVGSYDFIAGAREALRGSLGKSDKIDLMNRIAIYLAAQAGVRVRNFAALLKLQSEKGSALGADVLHFAEFSAEALRQMGGDYADWANKLRPYGLQREEFEVITLEFIEPEPFTFEVATIRVAALEGEKAPLTLADVLARSNEAMQRLSDRDLNELQKTIIAGAWNRLTYDRIAVTAGVEIQALKQTAADLFKVLGQELGERISKNNLVKVFRDSLESVRLEIIRSPGRAKQFVEQLDRGIFLEMVEIPAGEFMMGSPQDEIDRRSNEGSQHLVTVPEFFMGKYPITQAQWRSIAQQPLVDRELNPDPSSFKGDKLPVENVSWYEAVEFCQRLSKWTGQVYRLPSEAEWEYACRAGTTTPFHFGNTISTEVANYDGNYTYGQGTKGTYREKTTVVGSFKVANGFGLYDMHGNVWEWCQDHYHSSYAGAPADGSAWIDSDADKDARRMLRGGSWNLNPLYCRSACRNYFINPDDHDYAFGFRVVSGAARTS
jgi:formylglycine-generating enzyme required for sulfatase activity